MPVELRPHQVPVVYEKLHNGCILYGDVGVGKTITSLGYYFARVCNGEINEWGSMKTPKDVYVITTAKVRDSKGFELQAAQYGVHTDPSLSTNGVKITVDSWNNLHKYVEVKDAFFIFDEQRVVGYGAWARAFIKIAKHNEWILLSATPGDTWLDYIPVFIANGWYKHKTDFLDQHVIWTPRVKYPKVLRYQNVGVLVRRRNQVLVHMPYEKHTTRHAVYINCDYDEVAFEKVVKKKWHVYEQRPLRDIAEVFTVMRRVVNSDSSRLTELQRLMQKHPKLIVFYNFDYELEALRSLSPSATSEDSVRLAQSPTDVATIDAGLMQYQKDLKTPSTSTQQSGDSSNPQTLSQFQNDLIDRLEVLSNPSSTPSGSEEMTADLSRSIQTLPKPQSRLSGSPKTSSSSSLKASSTLLSPPSSSPGLSTSSTNSAQSFAIAEWNGHKHEEIPATERWLYLVQYRAGAEGWNCIETDAMVFYSQTYSYRDWWQAHGRIDRLNTPFIDLYYYHFISRSIIDKAIRAAVKVKKNFNERDLAL